MEDASRLVHLLIYSGLLVFGLVLLHAVRSPPAPKLKGERLRLDRIIDALGHPCHHDVRIVDQQGRIVRIQHVIRLPSSIVLVGTAAAGAKGELRGRETRRTWRITHRGRTATCVNPLLELDPLHKAFRRRFPLLKVRVLVVFPDTITFPDGAPRGVVRASEFGKWLENVMKIDGTHSQAVEAAWPAITEMIDRSRVRIEQTKTAGALRGASGPAVAHRR
jgi:hypothetical protein